MLALCFYSEVNILAVNARHIKTVLRRKTDMRDAQWITALFSAGRLRVENAMTHTFIGLFCCNYSYNILSN